MEERRTELTSFLNKESLADITVLTNINQFDLMSGMGWWYQYDEIDSYELLCITYRKVHKRTFPKAICFYTGWKKKICSSGADVTGRLEPVCVGNAGGLTTCLPWFLDKMRWCKNGNCRELIHQQSFSHLLIKYIWFTRNLYFLIRRWQAAKQNVFFSDPKNGVIFWVDRTYKIVRGSISSRFLDIIEWISVGITWSRISRKTGSGTTFCTT